MGEPMQLKFKKTDSFSEYTVEAQIEEYKLELEINYSEESLDKENEVITVEWRIPSDIPHDKPFNVKVMLKHKAMHDTKDVAELEKLFSVAIYENDEMESL